jgi:hypothetical protein
MLGMVTTATALQEFIVGPHHKNQRIVLNTPTSEGSPVLESCTSILYWLAQQQKLQQRTSSSGLSAQRMQTQTRRFEALMQAEFQTLQVWESTLLYSLSYKSSYYNSPFLNKSRQDLRQRKFQTLQARASITVPVYTEHPL